MAEIKVLYRLSPEGQVSALRAGRNVGMKQTIILRSPDHIPPEAPADIIARVMGWKLPDVLDTAGLADSVKDLAEATTLLARTLDPESNPDISVENATPELWELAVSLCGPPNKSGQASILCGYDASESGDTIVGFTVVWNSRQNRFDVTPTWKYQPYNVMRTAAELLLDERDRRATKTELSDAAFRDAEEQARAYNEEVHRAMLERTYEKSARIVEETREYAHLPEVAHLAALVGNNDREALVDGELIGASPCNKATRAVYRAKEAAADAEMKSWIAEYGSTLLRAHLRNGIDVPDLYQAERLQHALPGWKFARDSYTPNRIPELREYQHLELVQQRHPEAKLGFTDGFHVPMLPFMGMMVYYPVVR